MVSSMKEAKQDNADREEFYCANCGKEHGRHQAKTYNCPMKGRGSFRGFTKMHTFAPNYNKPLPPTWKL